MIVILLKTFVKWLKNNDSKEEEYSFEKYVKRLTKERNIL